MKNKLLLPLIIIALLVAPNFSFAVSSTTRRETIGNKIEARKEALKQNVASKTEEVRNSVAQRKQNVTNKIEERLDQFVSNVVERFNAAANRLDTLAQRIDSRIAKIESRGIDESEAKNILVAARAKIETAKVSISLITLNTNRPGGEASTTASLLKEAFETTKTQMETAKKDLKAAHAALIDVVNSLKPGDNKFRSATTTATTTVDEN